MIQNYYYEAFIYLLFNFIIKNQLIFSSFFTLSCIDISCSQGLLGHFHYFLCLLMKSSLSFLLPPVFLAINLPLITQVHPLVRSLVMLDRGKFGRKVVKLGHLGQNFHHFQLLHDDHLTSQLSLFLSQNELWEFSCLVAHLLTYPSHFQMFLICHLQQILIHLPYDSF